VTFLPSAQAKLLKIDVKQHTEYLIGLSATLFLAKLNNFPKKWRGCLGTDQKLEFWGQEILLTWWLYSCVRKPETPTPAPATSSFPSSPDESRISSSLHPGSRSSLGWAYNDCSMQNTYVNHSNFIDSPVSVVFVGNISALASRQTSQTRVPKYDKIVSDDKLCRLSHF
jgi:hypothetical protein